MTGKLTQQSEVDPSQAVKDVLFLLTQIHTLDHERDREKLAEIRRRYKFDPFASNQKHST